MDEITLVRDLGEETALPSSQRLAASRMTLMSEVAPVAKKSRRWAALLTAAAAAVVAAVAIPQVVTTPAAQPAPPAASAPEMTPVAAFLNAAATTAAKEKDVVPRGDQYLYLRFVEFDGTLNEAWLSIDGQHDSKGRGEDGDYHVFRGEPIPRYLPDMPTDPAAMSVWIKKYVKDRTGADHLDAINKFIGVLPTTVWMRPAQRAAFYRAIGLIDGNRLVEGAQDSRGRTGVGVAWVSPGTTEERVLWVFDEKSHTLLGTKDSSLDRIALVDRIDQKG
ncbi:CU044_5270 family protein [Actinoplanes derwentensis]|uniref:CU044_5270 family protein n=1 Tax=Actinoplanes derwentensis TaxID=113562 RepID=A0A1H2CT71_9ACTN|nr:CU044_5270 family protein [Actinoplanes derwentensis]GID85510.1 hypothetical protein Ade03nite_44340 [Actinoplanes derwentensis]SDT73372.1 hypothetical protein SAMN04489716_6647 [Actinoplanes derwentensis]